MSPYALTDGEFGPRYPEFEFLETNIVSCIIPFIVYLI